MDATFLTLIGVIVAVIAVIVTVAVGYWQVRTARHLAAQPGSVNAPPLAAQSKEAIQQNIEETLEQYVTTIDYDRLIGVEEQLGFIEGYLADTNGAWIISLFGRGGIGKTSIAYEAVSRFAASHDFRKVAWVTVPSYTQNEPEYSKTRKWAEVAKSLAEQFSVELRGPHTDWEAMVRQAIRKLPGKCLVVINGIEENQEIARRAFEFIGGNEPRNSIVNPHKVIITTRFSMKSLSQWITEREVPPLDFTHTCELIHHLSQGDEEILSYKDEDFRLIYAFTSGTPYLIKLVVGRLVQTGKSFNSIVADLRGQGDIERYLFERGFAELARKFNRQDMPLALMKPFCQFPRDDSISADDLYAISDLKPDRTLFDEAMDYAVSLALVTRSKRVRLDKPRLYSVHSLLRSYICGET